jgi:hypothetical protein
MRFVNIIVCLMIYFQTTFSQGTTSDMFPLNVGNKWFYDFATYHSEAAWGGHYADSGMATIEVLGMTELADSIRWLIKQSRDYKEYWVSYQVFSPTQKYDSKLFEIIEMRNNDHPLYTTVFDPLGPLPLGDQFYPRLNRFCTPDNDGYVYFSRDTGGLYEYWPYHLDMALLKDTGIVQLVAYGIIMGGGADGERYVLRRDLTIVSVSQTSKSTVRPFSLGQNYPNPFNPSTSISFVLPVRSVVTLEVFDLLGRVVEILINGEMTSGDHSIQWSPRNIPSGVYFYRLQASNLIETKKLILLH